MRNSDGYLEYREAASRDTETEARKIAGGFVRPVSAGPLPDVEGFEVFSNEFELCLFIPGVFSEYLIFGEMTADRSRLEACRTGGRPEISLIYNRIVLSALFIWKEARTEMMNRGRSNDELTFIYNVRPPRECEERADYKRTVKTNQLPSRIRRIPRKIFRRRNSRNRPNSGSGPRNDSPESLNESRDQPVALFSGKNAGASANLMSAFVFDIVTLDAEFICCNLRGRVLNKFRFDEFRSKPQRRLRGLQVRRDRAARYRKWPRIPRNMRIFSGDPLKKLRNECRSVTDNVSGVITRNRKRSEQILFQIWSGERAQCCKVGERVWLEFHRIFSTTMHQSD
uniref:Uncharacterized protein n=1 Tax=Tenebrio molitor TaxID=7067 RepID=A0A8J6L0Q5_TENMO|nr:hypothetical protein GEV33_015182 [Tenebrio molitor]